MPHDQDAHHEYPRHGTPISNETSHPAYVERKIQHEDTDSVNIQEQLPVHRESVVTSGHVQNTQPNYAMWDHQNYYDD